MTPMKIWRAREGEKRQRWNEMCVYVCESERTRVRARAGASEREREKEITKVAKK